MNKRLLCIVLCILLLVGGLPGLKLCLDLLSPDAPVDIEEEAAPIAAAQLRHLWVHGESALIGVDEWYVDLGLPARRGQLTPLPATTPQASPLTLRGADGRVNYIFTAAESQYANRGLSLWQLPPGQYQLYYQQLPIAVGQVWLPQGYSLPRAGQRLHWQFVADANGLLGLDVTVVDDLPRGWYDVIVDAGHGGLDPGAQAGGYDEAELNLTHAYQLQAQLEQLGLRVALTRSNADVPGGVAAEDNPYARGARVEQVYRSHAPYLLSCHLNAGDGSMQGFQVYASVESDARWAQLMAQAWREAGARENNQGSGLLADGIYQRPTAWTQLPRDYYFILRETGGYALSPGYFLSSHRDMRQQLAVGAEALLLEFAFLDNAADRRFWLRNQQSLLAATATACAAYWNL